MYSNNTLIFYSKKFNSFVVQVNNTNFGFDYIDHSGYHIYQFKDAKKLKDLL